MMSDFGVAIFPIVFQILSPIQNPYPCAYHLSANAYFEAEHWCQGPAKLLLSLHRGLADGTVEKCLTLQKGLLGSKFPDLQTMFHIIAVVVSISIKGHESCRISQSVLSPLLLEF